MLKNYFKIAFRNLLRHKGLSFINIFGLAIGIACCLLITLFIIDELSYDKHHADANRIYRVVKDFVNDDGSKLPDATTPPAIAPAIQNEIPEIEHVARLFPGWGGKFYVRNGEKRFIEENVYRADSSIFDVFTFDFIKGNASTALKDLHAVVVTETAAKKYFGSDNPIGKTLEIDDWEPMTVTAILKDIPENSHFKFDILVPLRFRNNNGALIDINSIWGWYNYYTYMKLKPGARIADVDKKIRATFKKNQPENENYFYSQPLTSIHLTSNLKWELNPNSDKIYIFVFGTVAIFIILIACINYVNLTTARSSLRAKEIGVRKVSGALKAALTRQFLVESIFIALLASLIAVVLAQLFLPAINNITQKNLSLVPNGNYLILFTVIAFAILIGLIAGFYPALYLSSFKPVKVLKGEKVSGTRTLSLRKLLVVTQFTISIALIIGTIVVVRQVSFVQNAKLGLDKEHIIMVNDIGYLSRSQRLAMKNELMRIPGVKKVAASDGIVGGQNWTNSLRLKGSDNGQLINFLTVDHDYLEALSIPVKEGRGFSPQFPADTLSNGKPGTMERNAGGVILNETAVRHLGIPAPAVGRQLVYGEENDTTWNAEVVGIVKDFHFTSMRNEIKPFAFFTEIRRQWYFTIKMEGKNIAKTIDRVKSVWDKDVQSRPFQYFFLDETYARLYQAERNFKTIFFYITAIAIFIACLGLFGLASFTAEQRTKEIGIRKVVGASISSIVALLSKDFISLVAIAIVIATPLAWYAMNKWLQGFVYRIDIGWWVFAVAGVVALLIAMITVSFQAIKAAIANPVKSLRTE